MNDGYNIGSDIFSDWSEIENGQDYVNIAQDIGFGSDKVIEIKNEALNPADSGIERNFTVQEGFLNITWNIEITEDFGLNDFDIKIYSYNNTLLTHIELTGIDPSIQLNYYNGGGHTLNNSMQDDKHYDFNLYIDTYNQTAELWVWEDSSYYGNWNITLANINAHGLGKITFINDAAVKDMTLNLDYIGAYVNSTSLSTEIAWIRYNSLTGTFADLYLTEHSLLTVQVIGNISFLMTDFGYIFELGTMSRLVSLQEYYNISETFNIYDITPSLWEDPDLWLEFYEEIEVIDIAITKPYLTDQINNYTLEFSSGNVYSNTSFFWVDANNRLQYSLTVNDNDPEYIQANFNIPDMTSENRSVSFLSNINGNPYGFLGVDYIDSTITYVEFPTYQTYQSLVLPQTKTIGNLTILITDNDEYNNDICTGFITNLKLIYFPDLTTTIVTLNLIAVMVPIMIIIFPPLAIAKKLGKSSIVPIMLLMSIICFATELIPTWVFVIIMICGGAFLFMQRKMESD